MKIQCIAAQGMLHKAPDGACVILPTSSQPVKRPSSKRSRGAGEDPVPPVPVGNCWHNADIPAAVSFCSALASSSAAERGISTTTLCRLLLASVKSCMDSLPSGGVLDIVLSCCGVLADARTEAGGTLLRTLLHIQSLCCTWSHGTVRLCLLHHATPGMQPAPLSPDALDYTLPSTWAALVGPWCRSVPYTLQSSRCSPLTLPPAALSVLLAPAPLAAAPPSAAPPHLRLKDVVSVVEWRGAVTLPTCPLQPVVRCAGVLLERDLSWQHFTAGTVGECTPTVSGTLTGDIHAVAWLPWDAVSPFVAQGACGPVYRILAEKVCGCRWAVLGTALQWPCLVGPGCGCCYLCATIPGCFFVIWGAFPGPSPLLFRPPVFSYSHSTRAVFIVTCRMCCTGGQRCCYNAAPVSRLCN